MIDVRASEPELGARAFSVQDQISTRLLQIASSRCVSFSRFAELTCPLTRAEIYLQKLQKFSYGRARAIANQLGLPQALARMDDVRRVMEFAGTHEVISGAETLRSGSQLIYADTVADVLACMEITHRRF